MSLAVEAMKAWALSPTRMVRDLFGVEPQPWQQEVLESFPRTQRIAMQASKGVGKTCVIAWLCWNFLLTRPHSNIVATAGSADQLADTLWTELARWREKSPLLREAFEWTKTRIHAKEHASTWWMVARAWSKTASAQEQANTLAGYHSERIMFILDESGSMPDAILATAEAALSGTKEGHIIQAGNPTHLTGPLYRAAVTNRNLWRVFEVNGDPDNPKRSSFVPVEWARQQIQMFGRDNPWVLVNIFGKFPPGSLNSLIGPDEIQESVGRAYQEPDYGHAARVLGIDVARFGDDSSIIFPRQGLVAFAPKQYRNIDGTRGAELVARTVHDWEADAVFIDDTGGYGASWIDNLRRLGHSPIPVGFAQKPNDARFLNKRAEMAFELVEWIKRGGRIPDIPELRRALIETTYSFQNDKLLIEPKDQIKARLGYSPDHMDALMLTFASQVVRKGAGVPGLFRKARDLEVDYNPMAEAYRAGRGQASSPSKFTWKGMGSWDR